MAKSKLIYFIPVGLGTIALIYKTSTGDNILRMEPVIGLTSNDFSRLKGFEEEIKVASPWRGSHTNEIVEESKGKELMDAIKDRTVKIKTQCGSGTGWFLDYEIPEENKYPTKWFIATNAHVINSHRFLDHGNKYKQQLPVIRNPFWRGECVSETMFLFKSENNDFTGFESPKEWLNTGWNRFAFLQANGTTIYARNAKHTEERWNELSKIPIMYSELNDPKLFYVPMNFLDFKNDNFFSKYLLFNSNNYYKDFAIMEINFESEREARRMTENFYNKEEKEVNFFAPELMKNKNGDELFAKREGYFTAGYPSNSYNEYQTVGNYDKSTKTSSYLTYWSEPFSIKNKFNQPIIGHVNTKLIDSTKSGMKLTWGGQRYLNFGYNYAINKMYSGPGASGSLVINSKREVLGLYRAQDSQNRVGFVEPLRSEGVFIDSQLILPKYDLILGAKGQRSSYKQQLESVYPNIRTHLKEK